MGMSEAPGMAVHDALRDAGGRAAVEGYLRKIG
jgi:hypothetical protein